jgi:hypothetical protein
MKKTTKVKVEFVFCFDPELGLDDAEKIEDLATEAVRNSGLENVLLKVTTTEE